MSSKLKTFFVIIVGLLFLTACGSTGGGGGKPIKNVSYTTGWAYNDPDIGGFEVKTKYEQETGPGLVLIEGGTFIIGRTEQDLL